MVDISVVVPTYNRSDRLGRCLAGLARQTLRPGRFEVVVAVDGSSDATRRLLDSIDVPFALRVLMLEHRGSSHARNRGIQSAQGTYVLNIDDDEIPDPDLVRQHLRAHEEHGGAVVIGRIDLAPATRADWYSRLTADIRREHYERLRRGAKSPTWESCYGGNLSAPRADLLAVGCFDVNVWPGADVELGYRLMRRGLPLVYLDTARVVHDDLKDCRRQTGETERRGRVFVRLGEIHPPMRRTLLGGFGQGTAREVALRRLAIAMRVSPMMLGYLHPLARHAGRERALWHLLYRLSLWRGVRSAVDRSTWRRLTRGTPVLRYHAFAVPGESPSRYVVSARQLRRQVRLLRLLRRRVLALEDLMETLAAGEPPPERAVAITIDDGYRDVLEVGAPILSAAALPFTVFVVTGSVGARGGWATGPSPLAGRPILSWDQIKILEQAGATIGAHTRRHPDLRSVSDQIAREEIEGSRSDLEGSLGHPVRTFAYPFGRMDDESRAIVREGFLGAVSVRPGGNGIDTPLEALCRNEVSGTESLWSFARTILRAPGA